MEKHKGGKPVPEENRLQRPHTLAMCMNCSTSYYWDEGHLCKDPPKTLAQMGGMLESMKKNKGGGEKGVGRAGKNAVPKENHIISAPTLKDLGIDKKTSMVAQQLANMPEDVREKIANQEKSMKEILNPHVSHNAGEHEWYTPKEYIELAREVMGGIDCDPASSAKANDTVKARVFYTVEDDGLHKPWSGNVWLNPPYGQPFIAQFVEKLLAGLIAGHIRQACVLVNNATETVWGQQLMERSTAILFPKSRVKFIDMHGNPSRSSPLQGQMLLYYGVRGE